MNTDPIEDLENHLSACDQRIAAEQAAKSVNDANQASLLLTMASKLAARIKADALPRVEEIASAMRKRGHHAVVILGEQIQSGPPPWIIAITLHLEYAPQTSKRSISDLHFFAEVDPDLDTWRIRSYALSQSATVRAAVPEVTFLPGAISVSDFVSSRTVAFVKAAFPLQP